MAGLDFFDFCLPGRPASGIILTMLACLDGGKRLCGEVDANIGARCPPLFAPRYPLCLRFGEQNLHISAAGFELLGPPAAGGGVFGLPAVLLAPGNRCHP